MDDFYQVTVDEQIERLRLLAIKALAQWGVTDCEPRLVKYRENAVYKVTTADGRPAALRLHRPGYHSDAELASELTWMSSLRNTGIAVPDVIPTTTNAQFVTVGVSEIPEPRQVDLLEWLDGEAFGSLETGLNKDIKDVSTAFNWVGAVAGRMHNHTETWHQPPRFTRHAWNVDGLVGEQPFWGRFWELETLTSSQRRLLERAKARVQDDLSAFGQSPSNYGLIHADLLTDNILLGQGDVKVLDFDDSGFGWHLFDLATALIFLRGEDNYENILDSVVQGYRTVRPLSDEQLSHLPLFFLVRSFTYLGWIYTRFETPAAKELAPMFTELASELSDEYLTT